jgi:hypothetical protein
MLMVEQSASPLALTQAVRAIAFYLPQFHPVPENDEWWGPGFSEWTNTAKARPLFRGHEQPHMPADLGFYDLRLAESRAAQAAMAQRYGVEAFCYWHYWFGGRRMLNRPFDEVLASGQPRMKFCLAWANHTWSGVWDGAPNRILIEQVYPGPEDDRAHFEHLLPAFQDERYLRVDGRPLFYIFRPEQVPDIHAFCERWHSMAKAAGLGGLYLVAEVSDLLGKGPKCPPPGEMGFDAGVYVRLPARVNRWSILRMRAKRKLLRWPEAYEYDARVPVRPAGYDGDEIHPCVYPNWDNTPRSGRRGLVIRGHGPDRFRQLVRETVGRISHQPRDRRMLFIKSWNEWAEGNYLEPDRVYGHGYLRGLGEELREPARA